MDKRLQNKNERAINKRNVDLIIAREEAKRKKRQMKERTGNPKIDGPLEDFERVYGYKFEPKFADDMKDGGLAMAIEKVKAKEMKDGGNVPKPKLRPKSLKADKTESLDKEFSKNVARTNKMNMDNVKKKKDGGLIGGQKKLDKNKDGKISGADFAMMKDGGEATPIMKGKRISESRKKQLLRREKEEMKKDIPIKKMRMGGKVEEYGDGGSVKGGKMSCRGMGAAIKGGGFSIR